MIILLQTFLVIVAVVALGIFRIIYQLSQF